MRAPMSLAVVFVLATVGRGLGEDEKTPDYSKKTVAKWIEALKDQENPENAAEARQALGPNGPYAKSAIPALIDALDERKLPIRSEVAETLADYGPPVLTDLVQALKRPEFLVRAGAIEAIKKVNVRSNESAKAVIDTLKDENPGVRAMAAWCLATTGGESDKTVPALILALQDNDYRVRAAVVHSLGTMGRRAEPAVPALEAALKDKESIVRHEAAGALMTIGPSAKAAVPALIEALKNKNTSNDRDRIAQTLGWIGPAAAEAIPALIEALQEPDEGWLKRSAAIALGEIGPYAKAAVPELLKLAKDKKSEERYEAIATLGKIGPAAKAVVPTLIEALGNRKHIGNLRTIAIALGGIGPEAKAALPVLMELARDLKTDNQVREAAAFAVIKIDPDLAAKEKMESAYLNVRLGKVPSVKLAPRAELTNEQKNGIKALIAKLAYIKNPDFGMSATLSGLAFVPLPEQKHWGIGPLKDHDTKTSDVFRSLVEMGPDALPFLLETLEDKTPTRLKVGHNSGPIFMAFGTEITGNPLNKLERRVLSEVITPDYDEKSLLSEPYTLKVGDVCFVAIGQIVGRQYKVVRYQPTAIGALHKRVRAIWSSGDPTKKLLDSLLMDYATEGVFNGSSLGGWSQGSAFQIQAAMRLLYYFPKETAPLIAERLKSFNVQDPKEDDWMKREVRNGVRTLDFIKAVSWCRAPSIQEALTDIYKRTDDAEIKKVLPVGRK